MPVPVIRRRRFTAASLALASWIAAPAVRALPPVEKPKLTLVVGGKATFYYLPLTIAEQLGYFKAEGLDVEIRDFGGGARALDAMLAGEADVCSGAFEHTINLQNSNKQFQAFVLQGRAPQIAVGVSTRTMAGYSGVAALKGRKIGVSAPGSSTNMVAKLLLARAGLDEGDVQYVGVGTGTDALDALRSGAIDAMSNTDPVMTMLELQGDVRIVADTRTLKGTLDLFGGAMPAACLYAPAAFVQKHPNTCQALANAIVHGLKWLQTAGPGDIVRTVPENYLLGDRSLYLASFHKVREAISLDGMIPEDGGATALRALSSFDRSLKAERIDLSRIYTNTFARKAKEKFKA